MRFLGSVVRRLLALTAVAGILVGPPIALLVVGARLLPGGLPSTTDMLAALTRPDDGRLLLGLLAIIGIAAWLILAFSIVLEAAAVVLRLPAWRIHLPGFGWGQSAAAALITAIIGAGATPAFAAPLATVASTTLGTVPGASWKPVVDAPTSRSYDVKPRDTLWRIAEHELGDPLRWREIFQLNVGRTQPDGAQLTTGSMLHPGWHLLLPSDSGTQASGEVVTVVPGQSLSRIAADKLGNSARATEIYDENRGREQPDGGRLADPDLLHPGWLLALPTSAPSTPVEPPTITPLPAPVPSRTPSPAAPPASPTQTAPPAHPDIPAAEASPASGMPTALWFSPLIVGGVAAALGVRRRLQRRRRRAHHRIAVPSDDAGRMEWLGASTTQAVDSAILDAALRGLGLTDWSGIAAPDLTAVRLDPERAVLTLAARAPMPPPFEEVDDGHTWQLDAGADLPLGVDEAGGRCAPYPALVSIARDGDRTLLVDLEQSGSTALIGPGHRTTGLLRHMAAELANSRWAQDVEVIMIGFGSELVPLNPARLREESDPASARALLRTAVVAAEANVERLPVDNVLDGRLRDVAADAWLPILVLAAGPFSDDENDELHRLRAHLARPSRATVGLVIAGSEVDAGDRSITIDDDGNLAADQLDDGPWTAEHMTADTGAGVAAILGATDEPDMPVRTAVEDTTWAVDMTEDGSHVPPEPPLVSRPRATETADPDAVRRLEIVDHQDPDLDADLDRWTSEVPPVVPMIGILGEPTVRTPGQLPSTRPSWFTEVLIYLALHPGGITIPKATGDLWPDGRPPSPATVRHAFYGARRWAGRGNNGDPAAPFVSDMQTDDRYRISGHLLDWDLFRRLRKRAQARHAAGHPGAVGDYETALDLLRGPVLSQLRPDGYAWLNNHDQRHDLQIPGFVVDTAHELVDIALAAGDTALARRAAEAARAVDVDAGFDRPLVDLMRVAHAEGNPAEMEQYAAILLDAREFDVPEELPPDTFAVFNELLPAGPRRRTS